MRKGRIFAISRPTIAAALLGLQLVGIPSAQAGKDALVVGGGCEAGDLLPERLCSPGGVHPCDEKLKGHFNAWRDPMQLAQSTLASNGWQVGVLYDANEWAHPSSWPVPPPPGPGAGKFTRARLIQALENEANKPHQPGDEFFLDISTHGGVGPDHGVCLGDGTIMTISELKPYLAKIKQSGVKIGVLDESCYSGNTPLQLADLGICAMSATSADETSWIGSSPAQSFYATGTSKWTPIRYFDQDKIVPHPGTPDVDADARISAAEAFSYAQINMPDDVAIQNGVARLPLSSECLLSEQHLMDKLHAAIPYLKDRDWEPSPDPSPGGAAPGAPNHDAGTYDARLNQAQCTVQTLTATFGTIMAATNTSTRIRLVADLRTLGYQGPIDLLPREINSDFEQIIRTIRDEAEADSQSQRFVSAGQPIPQPVLDVLNNASARIEALQNRIRSQLGILLHMACGAEKVHSTAERAHACENFEMWRARPHE